MLNINKIKESIETSQKEVAIIVLKDSVLFPKISMPLVIRRPKSVAAVNFVMQNKRLAFFVKQKDAKTEDPKFEDIHTVGTIAKIKEVTKAKDGTLQIIVDGMVRAKIKKSVSSEPFLKAKIEAWIEPTEEKTERIEAMMQMVINLFKDAVALGATVPLDILLVILNIHDPWKLADFIVINMAFKAEEKQAILEAESIQQKLEAISQALGRQIRILRVAKKLQTETGKELDKMQREIFLREQLKAIEKELGVIGGRTEVEELKDKIEKAGMPKQAKDQALKELSRLEKMPSFSPEISYIRTYLDWLVSIPWSKKTQSKINIKEAKKILDEDHAGLEKAKERVLEYLAVQKLVGKIKGPILCFVGPPGTGKTSIGKSIARSLGRKFFRMSLGGIRDEAEIRGHRRTYVGALPGRIIQGVNTVGSKNPVFMLDEIDKVGADFRGDPSAALLEALDPEQNSAFSDHYLEVPVDLSDVMFITTANILDTVPPALRDRMEVIEFPGYTEEEKFQIAKEFLIPKQIKNHGLNNKKSPSGGSPASLREVSRRETGRQDLIITDPAIRMIIREYTKEAGVRELEREIAAVCRKVAKKIAEGETKLTKIGIDEAPKYLGPAKFRITLAEQKDEPGVTAGLAWTQAGGDILLIEATKMPGKGGLILTGHLGKVMQESAQAAFSYTRSNAEKLKIKDAFYKDSDIHVHVPAGAIPKDGPSAGVAMAVSIISILSKRPVRRTVGMTGEITLRGRVLEVGGIKEKVLAAHRGGLKTLILPKDNEKDLEDIPENIKKDLKFVFAEQMDEVLSVALT